MLSTEGVSEIFVSNIGPEFELCFGGVLAKVASALGFGLGAIKTGCWFVSHL